MMPGKSFLVATARNRLTLMNSSAQRIHHTLSAQAASQSQPRSLRLLRRYFIHYGEANNYYIDLPRRKEERLLIGLLNKALLLAPPSSPHFKVSITVTLIQSIFKRSKEGG